MKTNSAALAVTRLAASAGLSSLRDLVKAKAGRSMVLVDISGSMGGYLESGETKIEALRKVVAMLRESHPVPVAAFGFDGYEGKVRLIDVVPDPEGDTPMHLGINFGKATGATHLVLVTDGQPDSKSMALDAARDFGGPIDVFYIGDGHDGGARFAQELAAVSGGTANVTDLLKPKELAAKIAGFLPAYLPESL